MGNKDKTMPKKRSQLFNNRSLIRMFNKCLLYLIFIYDMKRAVTNYCPVHYSILISLEVFTSFFDFGIFTCKIPSLYFADMPSSFAFSGN